MDFQSYVDTLQNLDPDNIGSWPVWVKVIIWVLCVAGAAFGAHKLVLEGSMQTLEREERQQVQLMDDFKKKAFQAANLDELKHQLHEMKATFGALLRQLPGETEVPGLLEDITQTGIGNGLEFESIDLGNLSSRDFYSELPIKIELRGGYHAIGTFISGISGLPRIVTIHDFTIESQGEGSNDLRMIVTAKTYRYNDGEE